MRHRAVATAVAILCALLTATATASASASNRSGVVLSVARSRHRVEVVNAGHIVRRYAVRGPLRGFDTGSRIHFHVRGAIATKLHASGRVHKISVYALVVRLTRTRLTVRLSDGRLLHLAVGARGWRLTHARASFHTGSVVLITLIVSRGGKVRLAGPPRLSTRPVAIVGSGGAGSGQQVAGTVVGIDQGAFTLLTGSHAQERFSIAPAQLAQLQLSLCDVVAVAYHRAGGLVADSVSKSDADSTGQCAAVTGSLGSPTNPPDGTPTIAGTVTDLSLGSITIAVSGQPSQTFPVATLDLLGGFSVGDAIVVTYTTGSNGAPLAVNIAYDDQEVTGTVTSVSAGSLTLTADGTGQSLTFTDDPSNGTFDSISVGDSIDLTYYYSNGQVAVDSVSDLSL